MKMLKSIISSIAICAAVITMSCTSNAKEPVYGNIGYEGAPLLSAPQNKASKTGDLKYGDIVELSGDAGAAYVKVCNIATGAEGYVDAMKINEAQYPLESPELADAEPDEPFLLNIETVTGGEITEGWSFWKHNGGVMAFNYVRTVSNDGRSFTDQHYYKGEARPGYLLLGEEVEYDGTDGNKLETPVIIYEDIASRAGVFVDGKCFTPGGQLGGFDTDDWE